MTEQAEKLADAVLKELPNLADMARAAEGTELSDAQVMQLFNDTIKALLWFANHPEMLGQFYSEEHCRHLRHNAEIVIAHRDAYAQRIAGG